MSPSEPNSGPISDENPLVESTGSSGSTEAPLAQAPATPPKKPRKIPLGEPVFGKLCWVILVGPMVIYLGGNFLTGYLESSKAHVCVQQQETMLMPLLQASATVNPAKLIHPTVEEFQEAGFSKIVSVLEETDRKKSPEERIRDRKDGRQTLTELRSVMTEMKPEEVKAVFAPFLEEPQGLLAMRPELSDRAKSETEFLYQLLDWEEHGDVRKILAEYYTRYPPEGLENIHPDELWFPPDRSWYPTTYTIVISLTAVAMLLVFPFYFRVPFKVNGLSVVVGVVGIFVWIGLWWLDKNVLHLAELMSARRDAFNPFEELKSNPKWMWEFMAIRFTGLVLIVPIVEEFFVRGWLTRYIEDPDWDRIPIGAMTKLSLIGIPIYGILSHPTEPLAAFFWFGLVTWLFWKTKSIWDCVVAHAVTNLLLGIFVVMTGYWELW